MTKKGDSKPNEKVSLNVLSSNFQISPVSWEETDIFDYQSDILSFYFTEIAPETLSWCCGWCDGGGPEAIVANMKYNQPWSKEADSENRERVQVRAPGERLPRKDGEE